MLKLIIKLKIIIKLKLLKYNKIMDNLRSLEEEVVYNIHSPMQSRMVHQAIYLDRLVCLTAPCL